MKNLALWLENIDTPRAQALRPNQNEYYPNVTGINITHQYFEFCLRSMVSKALAQRDGVRQILHFEFKKWSPSPLKH